ncbi:MAG: DegV family protein [Clostridiales bacterium]
MNKNTLSDKYSPVIVGDSCCDLMNDFLEENQIDRIRFSYTLDDEVYYNNSLEDETDQFYLQLEDGANPKSSQINVQTFIDKFQQFLPLGRPIIYIGFSSALSATYQSAMTAVKMIKEDYPQADISVVDTKAASVGEGMILRQAVLMAKEGKSKDQILDWIEENKLHLHHLFTVDELSYLQKGGRLSSAAAFLGDMLNIKPLLLVDAEGGLMAYKKERGRKKILKVMVSEMEDRIIDSEKQVIAIGYGTCQSDALILKEMILNKFPVQDVILSRIGPVIGIHTGPSVLALFFWGKERTETSLK